MHLPQSAVLDNNIFVFGFTNIHLPEEEEEEEDEEEGIDAEVYQIGGDGKWEKITIPSGFLKVKPISDPNNNRLIAYFDSFYAYNPNNNIEKWALLHQQKLSKKDIFFLSNFHVMADQVVGDNLILFFDPSDQMFMAHNISTNKWLTVVYSNKFDYIIYFNNTMSQLVHLGNDILCLADSCYHQYQDGKHTVLNFLRFSVKLVKEEEEDRVQLTPLSFHSIVMDDDIRRVTDAFIPF
ncbi:uncharacterized protein LOC123908971 [Trifolium pratense]|uniref:uncharacterized protein LOC123908971 n=1 Tax=Trifolium pratense TaxID=57577 RepID=UPI001E69312A|nr:uncharacterized protein LOC123908971 [Trifolium pratense]